MRTFTILGILFFVSACCEIHNEIKYSYKGTEITRIDECGKTYFTYSNEHNQNGGTIWAKYSGINDGFSGYLKFEDDGRVYLLSGDGSFNSENLDTTKFVFKYVYSYNRPEIGENVCHIMLSTRYEQEYNEADSSGIEIEYNLTE